MPKTLDGNRDMLSPGLAFLGSLLPKLVLPPAVVLVVSKLLKNDVHPALIIFACVASTPLTIWARYQWTSFHRNREMRALGAVPVPLVRGKLPGNIDILYRALYGGWSVGYPGEPLMELTEKYGKTFNFRILWEDQMFTMEPELVKTILATDFNNYVKGPEFSFALKNFLGDGVFNSDGDMWKFHRNMTRPFFNRDRISDFDIFNRHSNETIQKAREALQTYPGMAFDFQDLVSRFTLDSATEFLFGTCVNSLHAPIAHARNSPFYRETSHTAESERFAKAFSDVQVTSVTRLRVGWTWPLRELFGDELAEPMKIINGFVAPIIDEAMKKKRSIKVSDHTRDEYETLLDHLVAVSDDPKVIKDELLNILLAGRDTTAATLTFVVYFLALHPDVAKKLRVEILRVVGSTRSPTSEDIRELKYLRAVINETMRLLPPVPINMRDSVKATTWTTKDGIKYYIPPKTHAPYSVMLMQRCPDYWGPDAHFFDPDRFLDERLKKTIISNNFLYLPFNAGPRICLGQQFAYNEMSFFLVKLLQTFDGFTLRPDAQPEGTTVPAHWAQSKIPRKAIEQIFPKAYLTMSAHGGMWISMKEAALSEGV